MLEATLSTVDSAVAVPEIGWTAMIRFLPHLPRVSWALLIITAWMVFLWATTASLAPIVLWFMGLLVVVLLRLGSTLKQTVHNHPFTRSVRHATPS